MLKNCFWALLSISSVFCWIGCGRGERPQEPIARPTLQGQRSVDSVRLVPKTDPVAVVVDTAAKKVSVDTVVMAKPKRIDTVRVVKVVSKPESSKKVIPDSAKVTVAKPVGECFIEGGNGYLEGKRPVDRKEALAWGKWLCAKARCWHRRERADSALAWAVRGISIYEGASIFYLKSAALLKLKRYSESKNAAEIALNKGDFWEFEDYPSCYRVLIAALEAVNLQYPSDKAAMELQRRKNEYQSLFGK